MRGIFGGAIATILLGIYVHLLLLGGQIVDCASQNGCTSHLASSFNAYMSQSLTVIGGVISALVIAELAVTQPGEAPVARVLSDDASDRSKSILKAVTFGYVLVWLISGLYAFMKGMAQPDALPAFTSVGQAWLGLAVAAAYAYFGLKPK